MLEHLVIDDEPSASSAPFLLHEPVEAAKASYIPLKGAAPDQIMKAKLVASGELEELYPPTSDKETDAYVARAAVAPMLVGLSQEQMTDQLALLETPGQMTHVKTLLAQFDYDFLQQAGNIRNMLVTQLIEATQDTKRSMQLKAIELLGKVTEVGLFTEQIKHSMDNAPEEELDRIISEKIAKFTGVQTVRPRKKTLNNAEDIDSVVEEVFQTVITKKK